MAIRTPKNGARPSSVWSHLSAATDEAPARPYRVVKIANPNGRFLSADGVRYDLKKVFK